MAKRTFEVRVNFPVQGSDLIETVSATSWPAALAMAARAFKRKMKGSRIKALSLTMMQVEGVTPNVANVVPTQAELPTGDAVIEQPAEQSNPATANEHNG